jgi:hypothetical protein
MNMKKSITTLLTLFSFLTLVAQDITDVMFESILLLHQNDKETFITLAETAGLKEKTESEMTWEYANDTHSIAVKEEEGTYWSIYEGVYADRTETEKNYLDISYSYRDIPNEYGSIGRIYTVKEDEIIILFTDGTKKGKRVSKIFMKVDKKWLETKD